MLPELELKDNELPDVSDLPRQIIDVQEEIEGIVGKTNTPNKALKNYLKNLRERFRGDAVDSNDLEEFKRIGNLLKEFGNLRKEAALLDKGNTSVQKANGDIQALIKMHDNIGKLRPLEMPDGSIQPRDNNSRLGKPLMSDEERGKHDFFKNFLRDIGGRLDYQKESIGLNDESGLVREKKLREQARILHKELIAQEKEFLISNFEDGRVKDSIVDKEKVTSQLGEFGAIRSELENIINEPNNKIMHQLKQIGSMILFQAIAQQALKGYFQDRMTYETAPALGMMGQQGKLGSVLSSGLMAREQYNLEANSGMASLGMGIAQTGVTGAMLSRTAGGIGAGVASTAIGVGILAAGLGGLGDDVKNAIAKFTKSPTATDAMMNTMAQQFMNPQTLTEPYEQARNGLINLGYNDMGNYTQADIDAAGDKPMYGYNKYINKMLGTRNKNDGALSLTELGYEDVAVGNMLTQVSGAVSNRGQELMDLTDYTMRNSRLLGVDESVILGMLSSAQSSGVKNKREYVDTLLSNTADKDGNVTKYTASIAQAIDRGINSMAVKNVAFSADTLSKNVLSFRNFMISNKGNMGSIMETNPNKVFETFGSVDSALQGMIGDSSKFALAKTMGIDSSTMFYGLNNDPESINKVFGGLNSILGLSAGSFQDRNGKLELVDENAMPLVAKVLAAFGIDRQVGTEIMGMMANGQSWDSKEVQSKLSSTNIEKTREDNGKAFAEGTNALQRIVNDTNQQSRLFIGQTSKNIAEIGKLQTKIIEFMGSEKLSEAIKAAVKNQMLIIDELLGIAIKPKPPPETPVAASRAFSNASLPTLLSSYQQQVGKSPSGLRVSTANSMAALFVDQSYDLTAVVERDREAVRAALIKQIAAYLQNSTPSSQNSVVSTTASRLADEAISQIAQIVSEQGVIIKPQAAKPVTTPSTPPKPVTTPSTPPKPVTTPSTPPKPTVVVPAPSAVIPNNTTPSITPYSMGGFTGTGGRHDIMGVVHANEHVINQDSLRVGNNFGIAQRMNSGEDIGLTMSGSSSGRGVSDIRVTGQTEEFMSFELRTDTKTRDEIISLLKEARLFN